MLFDGLFAKRSVLPYDPMGGPQNSIVMLRPPVAGVAVDEAKALTYSAVWGCVRIIAETIGMLPWRVLESVEEGKRPAPDHNLDYVLSRKPNGEMVPFSFKETIVAHAVLWGNGYAEIERTRGGDIAALWPITPDRVTPDRDNSGRLIYRVSQADGSAIDIKPENMFHLKGLGFDGTVGYAVVQMAKEAISLGLATQEYGASFFGNGAIPGGVIEQKTEGGKGLGPDGVKNLLKTWNKKNRGSDKAHKTEFLDAGLEYKTIGVKPEEAQFLESMKFQVNDICRWFRVPPHKLADLTRSTFNNIESQNIDFVVDTIMPWAIRLEQEANFKLFRRSESKFFTKLNLMSLLRGDSKSRGEFYKTMLDHGIYDIDEVRAFEDLNKLPGKQGKLRMVPLNMVSVEEAAKSGGTAPQKGSGSNAGQQAVAIDTAKRMAKLENKRLGALVNKGANPESLKAFYDQYAGQLADALQPVAVVMAETAGLESESLAEAADRFAKDWAARGLIDMCVAVDSGKAEQVLDSWAHSRASQLAEQVVSHLLNECKKYV